MKKKEEIPKQNYIVNGSTIRPVGSLRQVEPYLEANVYSIYVSPLTGPELEIVDNIDLSVPKRVYGNIMERVDKSFKAYSYRERNTGILLSGERGMGKTLFIRIAINRALEMGIPVLMLRKTSSLESIIDTVNSITQPLLVVMDEFEKNFSISSDEDSPETGDQTQFLTMLDGLGSSEKRMFIASINSTNNINEFLLNRPGRFYYHFDFPSLGEKECTEYLAHETKGLSKKTIQYAVMAMQNYSINYDGLAAIATELNHGHSIDDTLRDLNLDRQGHSSYEVVVSINGFEYGGIIEDSLETLQQERDRYTLHLYCASTMPSHADRASTGYIGSMVNVTVHKFKIEMDKKGNLVFPLDSSTVAEIYCPDGGVKVTSNPKDDGDNYYLQLDDLKSVSMATLKPLRPARTAMYIAQDAKRY